MRDPPAEGKSVIHAADKESSAAVANAEKKAIAAGKKSAKKVADDSGQGFRWPTWSWQQSDDEEEEKLVEDDAVFDLVELRDTDRP